MDILISGASGLIGSALVPVLRSEGHSVRTLVRRAPRADGEIRWQPDAGVLDPADLAGLDAVVNLAGAGIGDHRWTPAYKRTVLDSRTLSTELLSRTLAALTTPPAVLLSGSAVGFYGDTGDREVDESSPRGGGFLADVCVAWEAATAAASEAGIRVCHLRTAIVVSGAGGAFARLTPLYKAGLGGRLGSGRQYQSWISRTDEVAAIRFLLDSPLSGPVNLSAPNPRRQGDVAAALGRVLHRPALLPTPGLALRVALGPFADEGILAGQRVLPRALSAAGFTFRYEQLEAALEAELG